VYLGTPYYEQNYHAFIRYFFFVPRPLRRHQIAEYVQSNRSRNNELYETQFVWNLIN